MTTFHHQQPDCARRAPNKADADTFKSTSQIASSICAVMLTKRVKLDEVMFKSRCSRTAVSYRSYRGHAKPLNCVRFFRLANSSPLIQRYPASRSRSVREQSGKASGKMSCATSAQFPGNCRAVATHCRRTSVQTTCKTTREMVRNGHGVCASAVRIASRETSRLVDVLSSRSQP